MNKARHNPLLALAFAASGATVPGTMLAQSPASADTAAVVTADTLAQAALPDSAILDSTVRRRGFVQRVIGYFKNSNKTDSRKKIDFGFMPGPNYSSTTGLGLGLLGTATYSADRSDPTLPRSNAAVYSNMTTAGFFLVGLRGTHIFPHQRYQLDYKVNLSTFTTSFWGLGYDNANHDANETDYRRNRITAMARFMFRLAPNTYLGPLVNYRVVQAKGIDEEKKYLWQGQSGTVRAYTAGLSFTYDSRDFMLNASRGVFVQVDQTFTPRFLGNKATNFSSTEVTFSTYGKLWKGAVLAGELHGMFNYGHTPWAFLAELGTNDRMRGYYDGRYRDQDLAEAQIELRQHIKGRHGVVAWVAAANAFASFSQLKWRHTLPNAGVGYRWEFKKRINIRIDYGLTRKGGGFIFNINEAF